MTHKKIIITILLLLTIVSVGVVVWLTQSANMPVLNPKGSIAEKERWLILVGLLLSIIVVLPVFIMLFGIAWKYRASNKKARYAPEWDHSRLLETLWWGIPCVIIFVLAIITWRATHELDPYKPLESKTKPITIQVVALQWKWLFIYPDQRVASVNFLQIPVHTPINFEITADAPMNSFWIPSLGGQVYAMSGMTTKLHLEATEPGDYHGSSANISGEGFAGMDFIARASTKAAYTQWVQAAQSAPDALTLDQYNQLAQPSENTPPATYKLVQQDLYNRVIMKYMAHGSSSSAQSEAHSGAAHDKERY